MQRLALSPASYARLPMPSLATLRRVRNAILRVTVLLLLILVAATRQTEAQEDPAVRRPNVLFISIDDLRPELGCYGATAVRSPNIDALAASGVVFDRAYCQVAVCNPSRVSIMTGLRPDTTRVWDLVTRFRHTTPDAVTLPQQFMKYGYTALSYGKIFHNPWPDNESWSESHSWPKSSLWSDAAKQARDEFREQMREDGSTETQISRIRALATEIVDIPDHQHTDGAIAQQGLASLRRLATEPKPFFLAVGFVRPHLPFVVPRKYWELYKPDEVPLSQNPFLPKDAPGFAMNTMYELRDYFDFLDTPRPEEDSLTEAQQRRLKHGYYAAVSMVDTFVGNLLNELDTLGLTNNTIVVLWSDHGWKLGEHNSWCKQTNYEIDARVPLIVRAPGANGNGRHSNALVELLDVYPTLCELAGVPVPDAVEGRSLAPVLSDPTASIKDAAFSQFRRDKNEVPMMGYSMRTDQYRYIEWQDRRSRDIVATELYDHATDPHENTNIAANGNRKLLDRLSRQLWSTLPQPPAWVDRPTVVFRNSTDVPLELFWITPNGQPRPKGVIEPGKQVSQKTQVRHQFRIRGPNGFDQLYEISEQREKFEVTQGALSQRTDK